MYNPIEQKDIDAETEERYLLYEYYNAAPEATKQAEAEEEDNQPSYIQPTLWPLQSSYNGRDDIITPTRTTSFFSVTQTSRAGNSPTKNSGSGEVSVERKSYGSLDIGDGFSKQYT